MLSLHCKFTKTKQTKIAYLPGGKKITVSIHQDLLAWKSLKLMTFHLMSLT